MRRHTDLDCPTFIRNGLDAERPRDTMLGSCYDFGGLVWRSRLTALFVDFCRRATSGELIWR